MSYHIRPATDRDAAATATMLNPIIAAGVYTIMDQPVTLEGQAEWLRSAMECGAVNVAICNDTAGVLGLQSVEPHSRALEVVSHVCDISTFVALDAQRQGIGRALMSATLAGAAAQGYRKIIAMIRADNAPALAFYQSQGFKVAGTLRQHTRVRTLFVDEVLAELFLD